MKRLSENFHHYIPLLGILFAGLFGFFFFSYDKIFQIFIISAMGIAYVVWGLIHHYIHEELHLSIVIEYVSVALLGIIAVYSVIIRG